ncbi:MAG: HEAT repeat domain-containing protein [Chloroflexi bacterium]|nr:HEAT repeat domain-containing protein [Chloroflexota bacterium]
MMTTASKRLVAYHISRLQDKNPQVRLKAINELMLLEDADALDALRTVFETDAELEVRKAAQEAGRAIFLKQKQNQEANKST